jgi:hypothetical protein
MLISSAKASFSAKRLKKVRPDFLKKERRFISIGFVIYFLTQEVHAQQ